jgi:multidrug efflux pump subunit AcrA (membrane-fusion protein)
LNVEPGETVIASSTTVARIVNLNTSYFSAEISDADVKKIKLNQNVTITFDTTPEEFTGNVTRISDVASTNSGGETVFEVDVDFQKANELPVGLKGDAEIVLNTYVDVLCIDTDSIITEKDKYFVYVVEKGKAVKKEIGKPNELDSCSIVDSLNPDTTIVITPKDVINGMKVKPNII